MNVISRAGWLNFLGAKNRVEECKQNAAGRQKQHQLLAEASPASNNQITRMLDSKLITAADMRVS